MQYVAGMFTKGRIEKKSLLWPVFAKHPGVGQPSQRPVTSRHALAEG